MEEAKTLVFRLVFILCSYLAFSAAMLMLQRSNKVHKKHIIKEYINKPNIIFLIKKAQQDVSEGENNEKDL